MGELIPKKEGVWGTAQGECPAALGCHRVGGVWQRLTARSVPSSPRAYGAEQPWCFLVLGHITALDGLWVFFECICSAAARERVRALS